MWTRSKKVHQWQQQIIEVKWPSFIRHERLGVFFNTRGRFGVDSRAWLHDSTYFSSGENQISRVLKEENYGLARFERRQRSHVPWNPSLRQRKNPPCSKCHSTRTFFFTYIVTPVLFQNWHVSLSLELQCEQYKDEGDAKVTQKVARSPRFLGHAYSSDA